MKKLLLPLLAVLMMGNLMAQNSNLIIFSDNGDEFTMYINGIQQNDNPAVNVKTTDLNADSYKVRLVFNNKSIPIMNKNVWFETKGMEYTYSIVQKKNGKYVLRPVSQTAKTYTTEETHINESAYEDPGESISDNGSQTDIQFSGSYQGDVQSAEMHEEIDEREPSENVNLHLNVDGNSVSAGVSGEDGENVSFSMSFDMDESMTTETTTTTTSSDSPENVNFDMDVQTDEENGNVSFNMSLNGSQSGSYTSTTTTTTTTSSSSSTSDNDAGRDDYYEEYHVEETQTVSVSGNCDFPMSSYDFSDALKSISGKTFEDSKLTMAQQVCKANCLTSEQIRDIMNVLEFEDSKLEFAKFAYPHVFDSNNYYKVNDAFEFELTIEELDEFINAAE